MEISSKRRREEDELEDVKDVIVELREQIRILSELVNTNKK